MGYEAAVFDMDGTILNTLEDLRDAVNHTLSAAGHRCDFTARETGAMFGSGAETALRRALCLESGWGMEDLERVGTDRDDTPPALRAEARRLLAAFKPWYADHCGTRTRPYPGVPALLGDLRRAGLRLAVVSNKIDPAVQSLCRVHFPGLFDAALGEREPEVRRKPAPDMTRAALDRLGADPSRAVYIGDSEIDLLTAVNSGLPCIAVTWGFRTRAFLAARGAKVIVDTAEELKNAIV